MEGVEGVVQYLVEKPSALLVFMAGAYWAYAMMEKRKVAKEGGRALEHVTQENWGNLRDDVLAIRATVNRMDDKVHELHDWHNVVDSEGVKVWYVRRGLETMMKSLSDAVVGLDINVRAQVRALDALVGRLEDIQADVVVVKDRTERKRNGGTSS